MWLGTVSSRRPNSEAFFVSAQSIICLLFVNVSDQNNKMRPVCVYDNTFDLATVNRQVNLTALRIFIIDVTLK